MPKLQPLFEEDTALERKDFFFYCQKVLHVSLASFPEEQTTYTNENVHKKL